MSEPTTTRKTLRHQICRMMGMEFFQKYADGELTASGGTATTIVAAELVQADDYWNSAFALITSGDRNGESREVSDFDSDTDTVTLEYALSGVPGAATFELIDIFPPQMIHDAINRGISEAGKQFPLQVVDETLVIQEDVLEYDLSDLTYSTWKITGVEFERNATSQLGAATGGGATTIDSDMFDEDDEYNDWLIGIYSGTGSGQVRTVNDVVAATTQLEVTVAWATNPDDTSKFRIWNPDSQETDWKEVINWRTDQWDDGANLLFNLIPESLLGFRMRLTYLSRPVALASDTSITEIPAEYLINFALYVLHQSRVEDNRADYKRHQDLADKYFDMAKQFLVQNEPQMPTQKILVREDPAAGHVGLSSSVGDPLDWS